MSKCLQKHVVLLKSPKERDDPFVKSLQESGYTVSCVPTLEFGYIGTEQLEAALLLPDHYSALIITSQNAVEALRRVIWRDSMAGRWESELQAKWSKMPTYCVGPATRHQAKSIGLNTRGEESGNAAALVDIIAQEIGAPQKPLFFPCGNLSDELLPTQLCAKGYCVESLTVYVTAASSNFSERWDATMSDAHVKSPNYLVFFSPSGVKFTLDRLRALNVIQHAQVIALGPSTKRELESQGITVCCTSAKPDAVSLLEAINSC